MCSSDLGDYVLTLAKVPGTFTVPGGDEGGPMTNGQNHTGSISVGDLDQWTFTATAAEAITIAISETGVAGTCARWIRLLSPTGTLVASDAGALVAQINQPLAETGTYTVIVGTADSGNDATGDYVLTLTR